MPFIRTILLLVVSFTATFASLNFGLLMSYVSWSPHTPLPIQEAQASLFPLSPDTTASLFPLAGEKNAAPRMIFAPVVAGSQTAVPRTTPRPAVAGYALELASLGVSAPIVFEPTTTISKITDALNRGVVHYVNTPHPGEWGVSVIVGHSSRPRGYYGKHAYVFSKLEQLDEGDTFRIIKDGTPMTFRVSRKAILNPGAPDSAVLAELENPTGKSVVLMTCWPTGTASKRIAVRAELVE